MTQSVLLRQIAYLKAENQIRRSRCPKNIQTTPAERAQREDLNGASARNHPQGMAP